MIVIPNTSSFPDFSYINLEISVEDPQVHDFMKASGCTCTHEGP